MLPLGTLWPDVLGNLTRRRQTIKRRKSPQYLRSQACQKKAKPRSNSNNRRCCHCYCLCAVASLASLGLSRREVWRSDCTHIAVTGHRNIRIDRHHCLRSRHRLWRLHSPPSHHASTRHYASSASRGIGIRNTRVPLLLHWIPGRLHDVGLSWCLSRLHDVLATGGHHIACALQNLGSGGHDVTCTRNRLRSSRGWKAWSGCTARRRWNAWSGYTASGHYVVHGCLRRTTPGKHCAV